jgi:hypothetical protein
MPSCTTSSVIESQDWGAVSTACLAQSCRSAADQEKAKEELSVAAQHHRQLVEMYTRQCDSGGLQKRGKTKIC